MEMIERRERREMEMIERRERREMEMIERRERERREMEMIERREREKRDGDDKEERENDHLKDDSLNIVIRRLHPIDRETRALAIGAATKRERGDRWRQIETDGDR